MKNILVLGSKGMLGYAVSEYFARKNYSVKKVSRSDFDISKESIESFEPFLNNINVVVNCAGVIKPRIASMNFEDVLMVNSTFPKNLSKLCKAMGIKLFHITTDCVYSGKKGNYDENDFFDADDIYGMTKLAGENNNCMVLRTSIIGEENNQSRSLLEWAKSQKGSQVNGFTNHNWNGVTTLYLAEIIEKILDRDLYQEGTYHIHSPNTVDKYELLQIFDKVYDLALSINSTVASVAVDRSMTSVYDLTKKVATKNIEEQVSEMKEFFEVYKILKIY